MRHPTVDMNLSQSRAPKAGRAHGPSILGPSILSPSILSPSIPGPSILARIHWPRIIAFTMALSLWPAIIYAVSRFL